MLVKLLTDLTKYNASFAEGTICHCDMVPFCHPNIKWQLCYNLRIGKEILAVGEDGFQIVGEEENVDECVVDAQNQALYTENKIQLADMLDGNAVTLIKLSHNQKPKGFLGLKNHPSNDGVLIDDSGEKGCFENPDEQRIYSRFVLDYCQEQKSTYVVVGRTSKASYYKFYLNGALRDADECSHDDVYKNVFQILKTYLGKEIVSF